MSSLLRVLSVFCLACFACIALMVQFVPLELGRADLYLGIATLLGLLLWLTRDHATVDRGRDD